jgi:hypothetical protein
LVTNIGLVNAATFDTHIKLVRISVFLMIFCVYNLNDHHSYQKVKKNGYHFYEDLAKYGYKLYMKYKIFNRTFILRSTH